MNFFAIHLQNFKKFHKDLTNYSTWVTDFCIKNHQITLVNNVSR